jgi:Sec-independent protein translocase protein TatA
MPWSFIVPAALSVFGASKQSSAAKDAAATTAAATDKATELQREMFQQQRQDQMPWLKAGEQALNKLIPLTDYQKFGMDQFQQDPGYAFRLSEGQKALDRQAAARGGLISGSALKAATRYGQDMGSQEYTNAFNRYQTERAAQLQPLQSLAGVGQTTANTLGQAGQSYATSVGNALINQGANAGNARMAGANAWSSALSGMGSAYGKSPVSFGSLYGGGSSGSAGNPLAVGEYADPGYWT